MTGVIVPGRRVRHIPNVIRPGGSTIVNTTPNSTSLDSNVYDEYGQRPHIDDVVVVFGYAGSGSTLDCTDNAGNVYTKYDGAQRVDMYYTRVRYLPTASTTFTATITTVSSTAIKIVAVVLRGVDRQTPLAHASSYGTYGSTQYFADADGLKIPPRSIVVGFACAHGGATSTLNDDKFLIAPITSTDINSIYRYCPTGLKTQRIGYSTGNVSWSAACASFNAEPSEYQRIHLDLGAPGTEWHLTGRIWRPTWHGVIGGMDAHY